MRGFWDEVRARLRARLTLAIWMFLTVMMAIAGPFGSYAEVPFLRRLLFWLVVSALALVLAAFVRVLVSRHPKLGGFWRGGVATAAVVAGVLSWPLHMVSAQSLQGFPLLPPRPVELAVFIFCLTLGLCAFRQAVDARMASAPAAAQPATPELPRLAERLPPEVRAPVLRISGRDHYVDVVTTRGSASLLMRFSDALAELDGTPGLRVHRSHWVAEAAVAGGWRDGARVFLRLVEAETVPVSRTYLPEVEARGWLDQA
ncbi:MAG: LytTR family DNA-binding domain-containing protein [Gemmobacter sp.]|uniref:LytTR family DNA-binding domain-containing protein n=1 Tax=Gemmobacter sp. TaxID=1898957 RepID=UPI00391CBB5D